MATSNNFKENIKNAVEKHLELMEVLIGCKDIDQDFDDIVKLVKDIHFDQIDLICQLEGLSDERKELNVMPM